MIFLLTNARGYRGQRQRLWTLVYVNTCLCVYCVCKDVYELRSFQYETITIPLIREVQQIKFIRVVLSLP